MKSSYSPIHCCIVLVLLLLLVWHFGIHERFVIDYGNANYRIGRGDTAVRKPLVWNKPVRMKRPLILSSLNALRFSDTDQSLLQTIVRTRRDIVRDCASKRMGDVQKVDAAIAQVNRLIVMNEMVIEMARRRTQFIKNHYHTLTSTEKEFDVKLKLNCRMTVDNFLEQAYFNNEKLYEQGNYKNWEKEKTFQISNFKDGRVFACKCSDQESSDTDDNFNHTEHAGLIIKSENDSYFSTWTYWPFANTGLEKNWRVYHSTNDKDPPDQNGVAWYKAEYDDSDWELPSHSTSGFHLDENTWVENYYKIWAGSNKNKYVWFRYKDRR